MKVIFSCREHMSGVIPAPVPSLRMAPQYFRSVKPQINNNPKSGTVKRCVPFLDALSSGFIISLWADMYVVAKNGDIEINFPPTFPQQETLGTHPESQIPDHPLSKNKYGNIQLKFINPWIVKTESGVSCLFTSPLNHMETRWKLLDGIVDTDTYYNNINFPFIWTGGDGEFFVPKGTPLVQVIPFRREQYELEISVTDIDNSDRVKSILGTKLKNAYRDEFWHKKKNPENKSSVIEDAIQEAIYAPVQTFQASNETENKQESAVLDFEPEYKEKAKSEILAESGYVVLHNLISQDHADQIKSVLENYINNSESVPDFLCPNSEAIGGRPEFDKLLEDLTETVSQASGKNLLPTYSYARMYKTGDQLPPHSDRPSCEYSVTLCLGMDKSPWPIFMAEYSDEQNGTLFLDPVGRSLYRSEGKSVNLEVGDGVLYRGMDMVHWREPFEGQWQAQVFLHWVDADGPFADFKYDKRERLSHHPEPESLKIEDLEPHQFKNGSSSGILEVVVDNDLRGFGEGPY